MSSSDTGSGPSSFSLGPLQPLKTHYTRLSRQYRQLLDRAAPHLVYRWLSTAGVLGLFMIRILLSHGWYIVCYALGIYLLNLLLAFLQPKFDPSLEADLTADEIEEGGTESDAPVLPSQKDDEFRPFVRRLPEWNFWLSSTRATVIALFCTFSESFDIPVYWPILVVYFCILFALTMRRQIQHMIKYKYIPFDFGRKVRYGAK
ncbi:retrieval of early ER protein Rer1 [Phellopilus nigrolimitatus]|nr:retrieval of early ER protein Rer1 [Phellopilus nigrolimitatus]